MTNLAKEGKYKIIEYFVDREDYQAFLAIDIEDGARRQVVVNRYRRGEDIRRLIPVFYEVQRCGFSDLADVFTEYGALNVAFRYRGGSKLAQVFGPKTKFSDEFRVHIEEELLHGRWCSPACRPWCSAPPSQPTTCSSTYRAGICILILWPRRAHRGPDGPDGRHLGHE